MAHKKNAELYTGVKGSRNAWIIDNEIKVTNFYEILEKSSWIWRMAGIFPFTIKDSIEMKKYEVNKFYVLYNIVMYSACIGNYIWKEDPTSNVWIRNKLSGNSLMPGSREFGSLVCMTHASILRIFRHKEISAILQMMVNEDSNLEKMNCSMRYELFGKIIRAYVWISLMTIGLLTAYDFYSSNLVYSYLEIAMIQWLLWIIPLILQILDLTIFILLVGFLGFKFCAINEKISILVTRANSTSPKIIVTSDVCAEHLRKLAKAHYSMCDIGKRINRFFAPNVTNEVISSCSLLTMTFYYTYIQIQENGNVPLIRLDRYLHWDFVNIALIVTIVAVCNWTSHQSVNTTELIHEVEVENMDSQLYEVVRTFSLQLHHQKLEFSASGFFPLSPRLIQMMVAEMSTYLIICIQFETMVRAMFINNIERNDTLQ